MRKRIGILAGVAAITIGTGIFALMSQSSTPELDKTPQSEQIAEVPVSKKPISIVVEPGGEIPMFNGENLPEVRTPSATLSSDENDADHHPEDQPVEAPGVRPEGVEFPADGKFMDGATKFDANDSHVALMFKTDWMTVVKDVRTSMEASGFTCSICIPLVASPEDKKQFANAEYILEMSDGTREVIILVSVQPGGTLASYTFQG